MAEGGQREEAIGEERGERETTADKVKRKPGRSAPALWLLLEQQPNGEREREKARWREREKNKSFTSPALPQHTTIACYDGSPKKPRPWGVVPGLEKRRTSLAMTRFSQGRAVYNAQNQPKRLCFSASSTRTSTTTATAENLKTYYQSKAVSRTTGEKRKKYHHTRSACSCTILVKNLTRESKAAKSVRPRL